MSVETGKVGLAIATTPRGARGDQASAAPFAAYVAHELRTPLATQRALVELALADPDTDVAAWREIGRDILDACRQQERLLDACLALSRSRAGLGRREIVDVGSLATRLLRTTALEGLTARILVEPALTIGDPALIERLVDNLLANAVRHNRAGGWIALATGCTGSGARLAIENPGRLISDEEVKRLFEPFRQGSSEHTRTAGGLGLGLVVAKAVADAHGARIIPRSRPDGGLRVEVAFPRASQRDRRRVNRASHRTE